MPHHYQEVPLLDKDSEPGNVPPGSESRGSPQRPWRRDTAFALSLATNVLLLVVLGVLLLFSNVNLAQDSSVLEEPYSPANAVIEYERRAFVNNSEFFGAPGPRWENAIHNAMEGTLIRVSAEELRLANMTSIATKDGGFAAGLGVGHNLHCVKRLKQFLYFEYFYPDIEEKGEHWEELQFHADHCLDFIRQSLMCHMDHNLYTLEWEMEHSGGSLLTHHEPAPQTCANWEKLHQWMLSRSTSKEMLVRPGE